MMRGESMWHAGGRLEMHASFSPGNLNVNDHLEDLKCGWENNCYDC